jgi:hypothetical protein
MKKIYFILVFVELLQEVETELLQVKRPKRQKYFKK